MNQSLSLISSQAEIDFIPYPSPALPRNVCSLRFYLIAASHSQTTQVFAGVNSKQGGKEMESVGLNSQEAFAMVYRVQIQSNSS